MRDMETVLPNFPGRGQKVFDKDGTPYIDTAMATGAILGHSNPLINATISGALGFGLV